MSRTLNNHGIVSQAQPGYVPPPAISFAESSPLYYDYQGTPLTVNTITITTSRNWYCTVDQSEITTAAITQDNGQGNAVIEFFCNQSNNDNWDHVCVINFYDSDDNQPIGYFDMIQNHV